jgi:micrococcal nuclease
LLGPPRQRQLAARIAAPGGVLGRSRARARHAPCVLARLALRAARCRCSLALVALAVAGCDSQLALEPGSERPSPAEGTPARVTKHTDGDTLWLSGVGKVRLIGVDTPEVYGGVECYGREASAFVERLLPLGSRVRYVLGVEERDRYGRALAYVYLDDGRFLNLLLAGRGYAQPLTIPPNVGFADRFVAAAQRARRRGLGLWARDACV